MSDEHSTTIGREKQTNRGLREDEAHFRRRVGVADHAAAADDGALRRAEPRPVGRRAAAAASGSTDPATRLVLDARPVEDFVAGHVPGAISVALDGGSFATRAAFVLDPGEPFVVHARSAAEAGRGRAAALGGRPVRGGSATSLDVAGDRDDASGHRAGARALLEAEPDTQVLDVREESEHEEARLPGAVGAAVPRAARRTAAASSTRAARLHASAPAARGRRSAASLLARMGFDARPTLGGGVRDVVAERDRLVESR